MATAPLADAGTHIPGEVAPNIEAEARKMGWTPLEEFKGDPDKHIDAATFVDRANKYMPIAKATIRKLSDRIDQMERTAKQASEFFSKAEQRAYERAVADIRAEQEAAVEAGDLEAHRAAADKLDKLEKPSAAGAAPTAHDPAKAAEEFADWSKENRWYSQPDKAALRMYADAQAELIAKPGTFLTPADLAEIANRVKAKFPEEFEEQEGAAKPRQRSAVEGGNSIRGRPSAKTYENLPPEAKAACDKFIRQGYVKNREQYVASYQWN